MFRALFTALVIFGVCVSFTYADGEAVPYYPYHPAATSPPQQPLPEREWAVVHLNNTKATSLEKVIVELLEKECVGLPIGVPNLRTLVMADSTSNSLIVSAPAAEQKKIQALIKTLDVRPPMVQVELVIVETKKDKSSSTSNSDIAGKSNSTGVAANSPISIDQLKQELNLATPGTSVASKDVKSRIKALEKAGRLHVVCCPELSALSGQAAQLTIGRDEPCVAGVSMSKYGEQSSINYRKVGLILTVTPQISSDGAITMEIVLTESHLGPAQEGAPVMKTKQRTVWSPRVMSTSAQSVVRLKSGQATILGGLATSGNTKEPGQLILVMANKVKD